MIGICQKIRGTVRTTPDEVGEGGEKTDLDIHQDAVDRAGLARHEQVDALFAIASEQDFVASLLVELATQNGPVDLVVFAAEDREAVQRLLLGAVLAEEDFGRGTPRCVRGRNALDDRCRFLIGVRSGID